MQNDDSKQFDKCFMYYWRDKHIDQKTPFIFEIGQIVRIKKTLTENVHAVLNMLGATGVVIKRKYASWNNWYDVQVGKRIEPFKETELDYRYAKKR